MLKNFFLYIFLFLIFTNISYSKDKVVFIDINYIFKNSNIGKELNLKILDEDKNLKREIKDYRKKLMMKKIKFYPKKTFFLLMIIIKK